MSEKRHKINKFANYQNIIVRNSPAFDRNVFVSSQDILDPSAYGFGNARLSCGKLSAEVAKIHSRPQCLRVLECALKLWETLRRSRQNLAIWASRRTLFGPTNLFASSISTSSRSLVLLR